MSPLFIVDILVEVRYFFLWNLVSMVVLFIDIWWSTYAADANVNSLIKSRVLCNCGYTQKKKIRARHEKTKFQDDTLLAINLIY